MANPGNFGYWQANEQPPEPPQGVNTGNFAYWQTNEQPPIYSDAESTAAPDKTWGWGWQGIG